MPAPLESCCDGDVESQLLFSALFLLFLPSLDVDCLSDLGEFYDLTWLRETERVSTSVMRIAQARQGR